MSSHVEHIGVTMLVARPTGTLRNDSAMPARRERSAM